MDDGEKRAQIDALRHEQLQAKVAKKKELEKKSLDRGLIIRVGKLVDRKSGASRGLRILEKHRETRELRESLAKDFEWAINQQRDGKLCPIDFSYLCDLFDLKPKSLTCAIRGFAFDGSSVFYPYGEDETKFVKKVNEHMKEVLQRGVQREIGGLSLKSSLLPDDYRERAVIEGQSVNKWVWLGIGPYWPGGRPNKRSK